MALNNLGQLLKEARTKQDLTQARLAREVGVSDSYLVHIEAGRRIPSEAVLRKLARALHLPPSDLIATTLHADKLEHDREELHRIGERRFNEALAIAQQHAITLSEEARSELALLYADNPYSPLPVSFTEEGEPIFTVTGPEGWSDLNKQDKRLVQQLINRLRSDKNG